MAKTAHFQVNPRLTRLLGETYRSSELALKELVDNAWDAEAENVWIEVPSPLSKAPIVVRDDGNGMGELQVTDEYLDIASDKRDRTGEITPNLKRKVKGRKGIGKFAGLTIAYHMKMTSCDGNSLCVLEVDKTKILDADLDLEKIPLDLEVSSVKNGERKGTTIALSNLDQQLNFPNDDRLKEILFREYGRERGFKIHVNSQQLGFKDLPGHNVDKDTKLPIAGPVKINYTIAHDKSKPKVAGISLRVDGKIVGSPSTFGLENDEEIPTKLLKNLAGEVDVSDIRGMVTADWGGVNESSKAYQEVSDFVRSEIKKSLQVTHKKQLGAQKARLQKAINRRLEKLPQHRREFAERALEKLLSRFYGESDERIRVIAEVALDAFELDGYWGVLDKINDASVREVQDFADALADFGLLELSNVGRQARSRQKFLDYLDELNGKPETTEAEMHTALDHNLWVFGRSYSLMASNETLNTIIERYCDKKFRGERANKRPDLLLTQGFDGRYLLIEFKRPDKPIGRDQVSQAEKYRDDLEHELDSRESLEIIVVGKSRSEKVSVDRLAPHISIQSYASLISAARNEISWLLEMSR